MKVALFAAIVILGAAGARSMSVDELNGKNFYLYGFYPGTIWSDEEIIEHAEKIATFLDEGMDGDEPGPRPDYQGDMYISKGTEGEGNVINLKYVEQSSDLNDNYEARAALILLGDEKTKDVLDSDLDTDMDTFAGGWVGNDITDDDKDHFGGETLFTDVEKLPKGWLLSKYWQSEKPGYGYGIFMPKEDGNVVKMVQNDEENGLI